MRSRSLLLCVLLLGCGPEPANPAVPSANVTPAPIPSPRTAPSGSAAAAPARDAGAPAADPSALAAAINGEAVDAARDAAVALARAPEPRAQAALAEAFVLCDKERRQAVLEALRDSVGAPALVALLSAKPAADAPPERVRFQTKQVMDVVASLADPRGADALVAYIATEPGPHWKTEAAFRLAEIGDLRAARVLGWRLAQDPMKLYDASLFPDLRRDDGERIRAARLLADLATMYPAARADLRAAAESQTLAWLTDRPQPHMNGVRFLTTAESAVFLPKLKAWAEPKVPLPKPGDPSFPPDFATAQGALRYLGRANPPKTFEALEKQLHRRPAKVDVTMDALMAGGIATQGMALRSLGVGAAHGFAELGDPRAAPLLQAYIEEPKENEQARLEACFALAWIASDAVLLDVARRAGTLAKGTDKQKLVAGCYLETLERRSTPEASRHLITTFMTNGADATMRAGAARALGLAGVPDADVPTLVNMLKDRTLANDAAVALLLGGPTDAALKVIQPHAGDPDTIKLAYLRSLGFFSDRAYVEGHMARWARNAYACRDATWPLQLLSRELGAIDYDNGPHSMTRAVFRHALLVDARGTAEPRRSDARRLLEMAGEKGVLMSLP